MISQEMLEILERQFLVFKEKVVNERPLLGVNTDLGNYLHQCDMLEQCEKLQVLFKQSDKQEASFFEDLVSFLAERWVFVRGSCLSYTSVPKSPINVFCAQLASCLSKAEKSCGVAGSRASGNKSWLEYLIPGIEVADLLFWGPILDVYPDVFSQCILSTDGQTLIPVEILAFAGDIRAFHPELDIPYGPEGSAPRTLTDDETNRLLNHSVETRALKKIHAKILEIDQNDTSLGAALGQLVQGLRAGSLYEQGSGNVQDEGDEATQAVANFFEFWNGLMDQQRDIAAQIRIHKSSGIPALGELLTFLAEPAKYLDCIWTTAKSLNRLLREKPELYKIQMSKSNLALQVENLERSYEANRKAIQKENYSGTDSLPLTLALIEHFSLFEHINHKNYPLMYLVLRVSRNNEIKCHWMTLLEMFLQSDSRFCSSDVLQQQDSEGYTALHFTARHGWNASAQIILNSNSCTFEVLEQRTSEGFSPLLLASCYGFHEVVQMILTKAYRLSPDQRSRALVWLNDHNPLHGAAGHGYLDIVILLVDDKFYIQGGLHKQGKEGYTALMLAIINQHEAVADFIINRGTELEEENNFSTILAQENSQGSTAFELALVYGREDIAIMLVESEQFDMAMLYHQGCQGPRVYHGLTPLEYAIEHKKTAFLKAVFEKYNGSEFDLNAQFELYNLASTRVFIDHLGHCPEVVEPLIERFPLNVENAIALIFVALNRLSDELINEIFSLKEGQNLVDHIRAKQFSKLHEQVNILLSNDVMDGNEFLNSIEDFLAIISEITCRSYLLFLDLNGSGTIMKLLKNMAWFLSMVDFSEASSSSQAPNSPKFWLQYLLPEIDREICTKGHYSLRRCVQLDNNTGVVPTDVIRLIGDFDDFDFSNIKNPLASSEDGQDKLTKNELLRLFSCNVDTSSLFQTMRTVKAIRKGKTDLLSAIGRLKKNFSIEALIGSGLKSFSNYLEQFGDDVIEIMSRELPETFHLVCLIKKMALESSFSPRKLWTQICRLEQLCQESDYLSDLRLSEEQSGRYLEILREKFEKGKQDISEFPVIVRFKEHLTEGMIAYFELLDFVAGQDYPLHYLIEQQEKGLYFNSCFILFDKFLDSRCTGELIKKTDPSGQTALMLAASEGDLRFVEAIIVSPLCDIQLLQAETEDGDTAASLAQGEGYPGISESIQKAIEQQAQQQAQQPLNEGRRLYSRGV